MRMLALPAAFMLSFCLYLPFPRAERLLLDSVEALYRRAAARFGDRPRTLRLFLLLIGACASFAGALHPVVSALAMAPLFTFSGIFPGCAAMKTSLDSGKFARDIPAYEANVRKTCSSIAPAFVAGAIAPLLLCAAGLPFYFGCGLGWMYFAMRQLYPLSKTTQRILVLVLRLCNKVFSFLLTLCSGLVGRNPLHTRGSDAQSRLMSILGIAQDGADTHAPMSGDISQAVFLSCFCMALLCFMLTAAGFALC